MMLLSAFAATSEAALGAAMLDLGSRMSPDTFLPLARATFSACHPSAADAGRRALSRPRGTLS